MMMNKAIRSFSRILFFMLAVIVFFTTAAACEKSRENPKTYALFEIHFIDVGQADSALVLCGDKSMLIDGGNTEDSSRIYTYLKKHNITQLDYIVATHAHEDHVGGLSGALQYASAKTALCPVTEYDSKAFRDFMKNIEFRGTEITVPKANETFMLGQAKVEILACNVTEDTNNSSIVLKITYGDTSFLFTGDAEYECEQFILENNTDIKSTVLKVGHHGSYTSTSYRFLREVAPDYAVISVGKDNDYGHPHDEVMSRLRDADVKIYRTDLDGDIICSSDGKNVFFTTSVKNSDVTGESDKRDFVLNKGTKRYHLPSCPSVSEIHRSNKEFFNGTEQELAALGYVACGNCHQNYE